MSLKIFRAILIFIIMIFTHQLKAQQQDANKVDFSIAFGDFFHNDTVTFKINNTLIVKNYLAQSNSSGLTGLYVTQDETGLNIMVDGKVKETNRLKGTKLILAIEVDRKHYRLIVLLNKGKYIEIDNCCGA